MTPLRHGRRNTKKILKAILFQKQKSHLKTGGVAYLRPESDIYTNKK